MITTGFNPEMINMLSREIHPHSGLLSETEVCPWTLLLTMSLSLLKGVLPQAPYLLPLLTEDEEMQEKVLNIIQTEDFQDNMESYFLDDIKKNLQGPINERLVKSGRLASKVVDVMTKFMDAVTVGKAALGDNTVRTGRSEKVGFVEVAAKVIDFAKSAYNQ